MRKASEALDQKTSEGRAHLAHASREIEDALTQALDGIARERRAQTSSSNKKQKVEVAQINQVYLQLMQDDADY